MQRLYPLILAALGLTVGLGGCSSEVGHGNGFVALFNGENLEDWSYDSAFWRVEGAEIVGRTTPENPAPHNTFLIWEDIPSADFELRARVKLIGNNNSGIQYRATALEDHRVVGYQCDIHPNPPYNGMLYEEGGRGIIATNGTRVRIAEDGTRSPINHEAAVVAADPAEWHDYRVRAVGRRLTHFINDAVTVVVIDEERQPLLSPGVVAIQLHAGAPYEVRIHSIELRTID